MSPIARPPRDQVHVFATTEELRRWFEANHDTVSEAFIGFYRKGVAKPSVTYGQIVEEALCFGWIDGITFRIDDEVTANRYTPRRRKSNWSAPNIARVAELRAAGRMHAAGIRAFEERDRSRDVPPSSQRPAELPPEWLARLEANANARRFWKGDDAGLPAPGRGLGDIRQAPRDARTPLQRAAGIGEGRTAAARVPRRPRRTSRAGRT